MFSEKIFQFIKILRQSFINKNPKYNNNDNYAR